MAKKKPLAENELYKAAPLLSYLEGDEYHPERNVLTQIEEVATLREAIVYSAKGSLKFIGEIDGEELTIDIKMEGLKKCSSLDRKIFVKATVGEFVQTIEDSECTLHNGFKHFMDIVKCVVPFRKGHEIPQEFNLPLEFWADTEEGKKFFEEMCSLGFRVNRDNKYFYESPCENTDVSLILPMLEYNSNYDHFRNTSDEHNLHMRAKTEHMTALFYFDVYSPFLKYAQKYGIDYTTELVGEWGYDGPKHKYGVTADKFLEFVKKVIKHNTERLDAISEQHGGLTWRGLHFGDGNNKLSKPSDYSKLPEAERKRIDDRLAITKKSIDESYDKFFSTSAYKTIYKFFKEHGTVRRSHEWQYGESHDIDFRCTVELEVPKKDRTLTKKTVEIYGSIQGFYHDELGRNNGDEIRITFPFYYATDKGSFASWDEAVAAGSNLRYGGSLNVASGFDKYVSIKIGDHYDNWEYKVKSKDLERIEKILLNFEKDNQQFLKDCHYKD